MRYKQPWCAQSDASTILLLPCFERGCFDVDRGAHLRDAMRQMPMQALAVGGQFALGVRMLSSGRLVSLALFPVQALPLFHTSLFVVVVGIIGASLPVHFALQSPFFPGIGRQLLAERDQIGCALSWHNRQRRRANIQADRLFSRFLMFWLDERVAL